MIIKLKTLTLTNFKGLKNLTVHFEEQTDIYGANRTGKTTLLDGFTWLLFGRDSNGSADFSIKTIEDGKVIHQQEHSVEAELLVGDTPVTLKRMYEEDWVRRRGEEEQTLKGHTTKFWYDLVPCQASEYKAKVDSLIGEGLFKLLSSVTYFVQLPWEKRRAALIQIAGIISNDDVFSKMSKQHVQEITKILEEGKNIAEYKKIVAEKKKKLKERLSLIPELVKESQRDLPLPVDAIKIESEIVTKRNQLRQVEDTLQSEIDAYNERNKEIQSVQQKVHQLKSKLQEIAHDHKQAWQSKEYELQSQFNTAKRLVQDNEDQINSAKNRIALLTINTTSANDQVNALRAKWNKVSEETLVFNEGEFICPACKQDLPQQTIEEQKNTMISNFERSKSTKLTAIKVEGEGLSNTIKHAENEITELREKIASLQGNVGLTVDAYMPSEYHFTPSDEYNAIEKQIETLELQVLEPPKIDTEGLRKQKAEIQTEIDDLKRQLTIQEQIDKANKRKSELMSEESELAQLISNLEKSEFAMESYNKQMISEVENRVNSKFNLVKWMMFRDNINGSSDEVCICTIDSVPYPDLNSASQVQAGVDIINTLSRHYDTYVVCWIDNRESVTEIPPIKSQVVNLFVSPEDKILRIQ